MREGKRPERTVYDITPLGVRELTDWLSELVVDARQGVPAVRGRAVAAPGRSRPTTRSSCCDCARIALEIRLKQSEATHTLAREQGLPRLFMLEVGVRRRVARAPSSTSCTPSITDLENDKLEGLDEWRGWYVDDTAPRQWFPTEGDGEMTPLVEARGLTKHVQERTRARRPRPRRRATGTSSRCSVRTARARRPSCARSRRC